jgi:2-phospho-L-lactate/phosphoenolpyruvate guanylyltransferase
MQTAAILPIKTFARAKHRLAEAVGAAERRELAEAMVLDVLEALGAVDGLDDLIVVTGEPQAAAAAREHRAEVVHDSEEAGQSAAATLGVSTALLRGAGRVLLVPGDCPALDPEEVAALLARDADGARRFGRPPARRVVIVPDRHGSGTNALLLTPPDAVPPAFGAGSFARHAALARAAGATAKVASVPSLGLDVDTPGDLAELHSALAARPHGARRTRAVLARLLPAPAAAG